MMQTMQSKEIWFVTGTQHLYGEETLRQVTEDSQQVAQALDDESVVPVRVVFQPILTSAEAVTQLMVDANSSPHCIGLITWMHTFSPAKMWIAGLQQLNKPFLHLHTQFHRDIPWSDIDMDYMNLHQSAHGGREFGFICTRLRLNRKVVAGHWKDAAVRARVGTWVRAAAAWDDAQGAKIARFGDNMRDVAVTEGNKVSAQQDFGYRVYGYGVGDLVDEVNAASESQVDDLCATYGQQYRLQPGLESGGNRHSSLRDAARIELGIRAFLEKGDFIGFTTTFEDLHGLKQLPGIAAQRLMADGYGFGAEGDWKTAALVRAMKVMAVGLDGGTSFMEDYTYHFDPGGMGCLGAHMLEICPSIASAQPTAEVHPLGIGGKEDPVRLVFTAPPGPAINASVIDLGNRFRLLVNEVAVGQPKDLPRLPVARALWEPKPSLDVAAEAWILAGGAHHTGFSQAVGTEHLEDFAKIAGIECVVIDDQTNMRGFQADLRAGEVYYHLNRGFI